MHFYVHFITPNLYLLLDTHINTTHTNLQTLYFPVFILTHSPFASFVSLLSILGLHIWREPVCICSIFLFYFMPCHPMYFIMVSFLCLFLYHSTSGHLFFVLWSTQSLVVPSHLLSLPHLLYPNTINDCYKLSQFLRLHRKAIEKNKAKINALFFYKMGKNRKLSHRGKVIQS